MTCIQTVLYVWVWVSTWMTTAADVDIKPKAENVRWVSMDFKTILVWTATPSQYTYTVLFSEDEGDWETNPDCIQKSHTDCDMSNSLRPFDRTYTADIQTEPADISNNYDMDEFPHTYSPPFNPYRHSEISAVNFTVEVVEETAVMVNITDPLTGIYDGAKRLSIRDVLKDHLKYKITYYKSGSTGKKDIISDSSVAKVTNLDAGESYCFMVAAYIPSRDKEFQQGEWSSHICTPEHVPRGLSLGALVGGLFILLVVLIAVVTVAVFCCKCCRQRNKNIQQSSQSTVV